MFDLDEARVAVSVTREHVEHNGLWLHKKTGGHYWVLAVSLNEADGVVLVSYVASHDGTVWTRPADEFLDGRFVRLERLGAGL